jgi:hypothetical protein
VEWSGEGVKWECEVREGFGMCAPPLGMRHLISGVESPLGISSTPFTLSEVASTLA